jgi:hypothetical protein
MAPYGAADSQVHLHSLDKRNSVARRNSHNMCIRSCKCMPFHLVQVLLRIFRRLFSVLVPFVFYSLYVKATATVHSISSLRCGLQTYQSLKSPACWCVSICFDCESQDCALLLRRAPALCVLKSRDSPLPVSFDHRHRGDFFQERNGLSSGTTRTGHVPCGMDKCNIGC